MGPHRRACFLLLLALTFIAAPAGAQQAPVTGTFRIIWGDPRTSGAPVELHVLLADDGRSLLLDIPRSELDRLGPLEELNRRRIEVRGAVAADARQPAAPLHPSMSVIEVSSLRQLESGQRAHDGPRADMMDLGSPLVSQPYVTILCRFADSPNVMPAARAHYESLMGESYPGVSHYWKETSAGRVDLAGSVVVGWYDLPHPRSHYITPNTTFGSNLSALKDDCAGAADADVHFPTFAGINFQFNQALDCCSWGGGGFLELDGVRRIYGMTWMADWATNSLGVYAHEVGHAMGLPHSGGPYGRTYDSHWDVMSAAGWFRPEGSPFMLGAQTIAYHKNMLGWIPSSRKYEASAPRSTVLLERSALPPANDNFLMIRVPVGGSNAFYTVEARRRVGYDEQLREGVVIHCVLCSAGDPAQVVDADGNGNVNDDGSVWTVGERFVDVRNGVTITVDSMVGSAYGVTVLQGALLTARPVGGGGLRRVTVGTDTTFASAVPVHIAGRTVPAGAAWNARVKGQRIGLETSSGASGDAVRWRTRTAGLGAGTYVDTIALMAPEPSFEAVIVDTLVVEPTASLHAGLSRTSGRRELASGHFGGWESVELRISGAGSAGAAWVASSRSGGFNFLMCTPVGNGRSCTTSSGVSGNGTSTIEWHRSGFGLSPGMYVDTLRIDVTGAAGGSALLIDTLYIRPAMTLEVTPHRFSGTLPQGARGAQDSAFVRFNSDWQADGQWMAGALHYLRPQKHLRLLGQFDSQAEGVGDGVIRFERTAESLPPGVYVDTIIVFPRVDSEVTRRLIIDTLTVTPAGTPAIRFASSSRTGVAIPGESLSTDSVRVFVTGEGSADVWWTATSRARRSTFVGPDAFTAPGRGKGSGWVRWIRNTSDLGPGWSVDTITVSLDVQTSSGVVRVSAVMLDSLQVMASPGIVQARAGRHRASFEGGPMLADSALVEVQGFNADNVGWTVRKTQASTRLDVSSGFGNGWVRWTRRTDGLQPGLHVDTLVVRATGIAGMPWQLVDTLRIMDPVAVATASARDAGIGGTYSDTLRATGGDGTYEWALHDRALPPGILLDATGRLHGTPSELGEFRFTVRTTSAAATATRELTLAVIDPARIVSDSVRRQGIMGAAHADTLRADGGLSPWRWHILEGAVPAGLQLDSISGVIGGIPEADGATRFVVQATSGQRQATKAMLLTVAKPVLQPGAILDQLLGARGLTAAEVRFLDMIGNRNGRLDVGDVRAWLVENRTIDPAVIAELQTVVESAEGLTPHTRQEMERR